MHLATVLKHPGIANPISSTHDILSNVPTNYLTYSSLTWKTSNGRRAANMGLGGHLSDPANILASHQRLAVDALAVAASSISIIACLTVTYWFFMMKRNFRRHLVLMLVLADLFKAVWFLTIAVTITAGNGISSSSTWCQFNGFAAQASIIACDYAVLIMSIHMYLQIFKPSSGLLGNDGLYRVRYIVYAGWLILPTVDAALAFINPGLGYLAQGPFCSLPIRPYWYRLALTWIPRYLIWIVIFAIAIRIYLHVGKGFRVFARERDRTSSIDMGSVAASRNSQLIQTNEIDLLDLSALAPKPAPLAHVGDATSTPGGVNWNPSYATPSQEPLTPTKLGNSTVSSRRGSRVAFQGLVPMELLPLPANTAKRGSTSTMSFKSNKSYGGASAKDSVHSPSLTPVNLTPIEETNTNLFDRAAASSLRSANDPMAQRRRLIQRQLRLVFIYPCVYLILWILPFIQHSFNYSDYYAQHQVFALAVLSVFCQSIMGFCDCLVFSWREKPWHHIPDSDGSFWGSFRFWTFGAHLLPVHSPSVSDPADPGDTQAPQRKKSMWNPAGQPTTPGRSTAQVKRQKTHKKTFSSSSDRATMEAERAAQRLAMERAENERRRSMLNPPARRDWWDRRLSDFELREEDGERSGSTSKG